MEIRAEWLELGLDTVDSRCGYDLAHNTFRTTLAITLPEDHQLVECGEGYMYVYPEREKGEFMNTPQQRVSLLLCVEIH